MQYYSLIYTLIFLIWMLKKKDKNLSGNTQIFLEPPKHINWIIYAENKGSLAS